MSQSGARVLLLMLVFMLYTTVVRAEDWARFRGPRGDGISADEKIPTEWSDSKNIKWKLKLPGAGFSSPIVIGKHIFVTAYEGSREEVERHLVCVSRSTGDIVWKKSVTGVSDGGEPGFANHGQASHTPVSDGEHVFAMFGSSGVRAFTMSGELVWEQQLGNQRASRFGTASSPILHGNLLIVTAGAEAKAMFAFDKKTGKQVWKASAGSFSASYSTPLVVARPGSEAELLFSVREELWSLNPLTGKLKWYAETKVDTAACPAVIVKDDIAYVIGGRSGGRTAVRIGGKGDVTDSNVVWSFRIGSYVPSPVLHNGRLYWVTDKGVALCVDAKTGQELGRRRIGGQYYASVVLIKDKLYAVSRFSGTRVLAATPEFDEIAHNTLTDDSDFSGSPAVSDGQLLIRSDKFLYCIAVDE